MNYNYFVDISSCFIITAFIGICLSSIMENIIDWLNSNKGNIGKRVKTEIHGVHPLMKKYFSVNKVKKALEYNTIHQYFSDLNSSINGGIKHLVILFGITPFIINFLLGMTGGSTYWSYILFTVIMSIVKTAVDIPFSYYSTFKIEGDFGFNNSSKGLFILDTLKSFAISVVFSSIMITILNFVLTYFGPFNSIGVCCLVAGFILFGFFMEFLGTTVFIRIFNKLEPLKNTKLRKRIEKLLQSYGYGSQKVFVIDGSKRSNHANAFIGGIGKSKKIVLFDTLLKNYTDDEIVAILGHELAHGKLKHLVINRVMSGLTLLITTFVVFSLIYNVNMYHAFGFKWINEENVVEYSLIGFNIALFMISTVSWIFSPFSSYVSRKMEYAADRYSVIYTKKKEPMITALIKLSSENLSDMFPHKWYEFWNYDHPSILNRIGELKKIRTKNNK